MRKSNLALAVVGTALTIALGAGEAQALSTRTFSFTSGARSASAVFDITSGNLKITLTNTSGADALVATDILTGLFFDLQAGNDPSLIRVSASLAGTSTVINPQDSNGATAPAFAPVSGPVNTQGTGANGLGGEFAYNVANGGLAYSLDSGVSSSGLGLFGPDERFRLDSNLEGPDSPNGIQYGITTAGDNPNTPNSPGGIFGTGLIKNSVVFEFSGLPTGYDLASMGARVTFQYGTDLSEPHFDAPNPAAALLLSGGLAGLLGLRRFRKARRAAR